MTNRKDIAALLRDRIISGHYTPGSKLPSTRDLTDEFGGSRTTVGAALRLLAEEGLVDLRDKSAAVVCLLKSADQEPELHSADTGKELSTLHSSWWVRLQLDVAVTDKQIVYLAQRFESATVDPTEARTTVNTYISALSVRQAVSGALELINTTISAIDVDAVVVQVEAKSESDRIRDLAARTTLDVVGVAEIQEILGINSRQQVDQLAATDEFPRPAIELRSGRIWLRSDIEQFKPRWEPRRRKSTRLAST